MTPSDAFSFTPLSLLQNGLGTRGRERGKICPDKAYGLVRTPPHIQRSGETDPRREISDSKMMVIRMGLKHKIRRIDQNNHTKFHFYDLGFDLAGRGS